MERKIIFCFFLSLIVSVVFTSCKKGNGTVSREDQIEQFRSELTEKDTTEMLSICDQAMDLLKQRKIDDVIASLYEYNDSTKELKPLSASLSKRYQRQFTLFPVLDYERQYYSFMLEGCNDVKYLVTFATTEQTGTGQPATTMYMFNPVKVDGEWKLCVKTSSDGFDTEMQ